MPYIDLDTHAGTIRGFDDGRVRSFLGVPYGEDAGGVHRFHRPRPVEPWQGVRPALSFGPSCPQFDARLHWSPRAIEFHSLLYPRGGWALEGTAASEDCLRLNVWAPSNVEGAAVLVWLHGGGYMSGSGNEMAFNGDLLAAAEGVIVVTVTHRLGILGFLDLRDHGLEDSADAGMLDIIEALRWVRANIAALGGDPAKVTIAGQSGGGGKVAALRRMPEAQDLFSATIIMSGPAERPQSVQRARAIATRTLDALAVPVAQLALLPVDDLIQAQSVALADGADLGGDVDFPAMSEFGYGPSLDAQHLPEGPDLCAAPMMIGWATHDMSSLLLDQPFFSTELDPQSLASVLSPSGPSNPDAVPATSSPAPVEEPAHLVLARALSAHAFAAPSLRIADQVSSTAPVWVYEFTQTTEVMDGLLGACHSLDLAYVFGTVDRIPLTGTSDETGRMSRRMMQLWGSFVREHTPAEAGWSPWDPSGRHVHRIPVATA
ncbi:MAG: carboxylesterase family protein [Microbacterium sp.]|uniref:carboxylesterase/lipase family protein n=1 Tax=Microbacterium sp. TaxID=51671 RepID=UPI001ACE1296|nr:carboxylesterase family protein [Microbacterium sp.]MBN9176989.1 carboxylesterase family protein [Microbacterium sp.]